MGGKRKKSLGIFEADLDAGHAAIDFLDWTGSRRIGPLWPQGSSDVWSVLATTRSASDVSSASIKSRGPRCVGGGGEVYHVRDWGVCLTVLVNAPRYVRISMSL